MTTETRILLTMKWKEQAIEECLEQATVSTCDPARLHDYVMGVKAGWDQAISTMKLHGIIEV